MVKATPPSVGREISTIAFPYLNLEDVTAVARAMLDAGGVPMDRDQLASTLGHLPTGGAFANKVSAARMFGLIDNDNGRYQLSTLGFEILDPVRERAAKVQAFLNVPLYRKTYETYRGRQLPPKPVGLEQAFVSFGVSPKQRENARRAFERSARAAGFFPTPAEDRLVEPILGPAPVQSAPAETPSPFEMGLTIEQAAAHMQPSPYAPPSRTLNPFIEGLLDEIPEKGAPWSLEDQANWLQAAAQIFRILYKGDGEIVVTVKKAGGYDISKIG